MQNVPKPSEFVHAIAPALRQAAEIARELEGRVANRPKSGEPTDVKAALTAADTEAQEAILTCLLEHFPDVSLRAEEDTPTVGRFPSAADASVIIDPIDGTLRFYLEGAGPYAVMVGLAVGQEYSAALVSLPREGYLFEAIRGGGARVARGNGAARPAELHGEGRRVFVSHDLRSEAVAVLRDGGMEVVPACGGAISLAPLLSGVRAGLRVATNEPPNVSIRGRVGALIAAEAGALVRCESGGLFPTAIDSPTRCLLVAADEATLEVLQAALAAAGIE